MKYGIQRLNWSALLQQGTITINYTITKHPEPNCPLQNQEQDQCC